MCVGYCTVLQCVVLLQCVQGIVLCCNLLLQCVAMCCRRLVGCSLLQCVQHVAVVHYVTGCRSVLMCVVGAEQVVLCSSVRSMVQRAALCCRVLQSVAECCNMLQCVASAPQFVLRRSALYLLKRASTGVVGLRSTRCLNCKFL